MVAPDRVENEELHHGLEITDTFVAGSAIFGSGKDSDPNRYDTVVKSLRDALAKV